jgi:hypothetical protein
MSEIGRLRADCHANGANRVANGTQSGGFAGYPVEIRPNDLLASRHAESAFVAERGNQGGLGHWGEPPFEEARKLFQREPDS